MTAKRDLPRVPQALEDVALTDGPTSAAAGNESLSTFNEGVKRTLEGKLAPGEVPHPTPVIRGHRFTRYRVADVRAWLIARAAQGVDATAAERIVAKAKRASDARKRKRAAITAAATQQPRSLGASA